MGASTGLWMLGVLGILIVLTGLPVWALLIGVASASAGIGLLEHDLLQALPLYVFIGVLLQRLTLAERLFSSLQRLWGRSGAGASLAALSVGALIAPMNGSVASSSALLARLLAPRLGSMKAAGATALLPALCVLLLWVAVAWWQGQKTAHESARTEVRWSQEVVSLITVLTIVLLLAAVFTGKMFAVEAAATGGMLLLAAALLTRALNWAQWRMVLADTLALTGALLALLVGASTFSLVFRLFGTDRWISELVLSSILTPAWTAAWVLLAVALCAWVLDAFEMIFVVIPIVAPPLIVLLGDAQQTAVLLLLVLQLSFLIPPMGYAVLIARSRTGLKEVAMPALLKALLPFILVQCAVTGLVFAVPLTVHQLDASGPAAADASPMSSEEIDRQMREMARQTEPLQAPTEQAELAK